MFHNRLQGIWDVPDLSAGPAELAVFEPLGRRGPHVRRKDAVCADHGLPAVEDIPPPGVAARREPRREHAALRRAVPRAGVRATHRAGKPARLAEERFPCLGLPCDEADGAIREVAIYTCSIVESIRPDLLGQLTPDALQNMGFRDTAAFESF